MIRATTVITLEHLAKNKEASWRQKSRVLWRQQGDKNARFFHKMATTHKRYNTINRLVVRGEEIVEPEDIKMAMVDFYKSLYSEMKHGDLHSNIQIVLRSQMKNKIGCKDLSQKLRSTRFFLNVP